MRCENWIKLTIFQDKATMIGEEVEAKADDSDYYTPEDPHTTILSPVKSPSGPLEKVCFSEHRHVAFLTSFHFCRKTLSLRWMRLKTRNFRTHRFPETHKYQREVQVEKAIVPAHPPGNCYHRFQRRIKQVNARRIEWCNLLIHSVAMNLFV